MKQTETSSEYQVKQSVQNKQSENNWIHNKWHHFAKLIILLTVFDPRQRPEKQIMLICSPTEIYIPVNEFGMYYPFIFPTEYLNKF